MEMIIENRIRLKNYPSVLQDILIDTLKIPNPKYIEAQAAGRSVYGLSSYIMNFSVLPDDSLLIPRGLRQLVIDKSNELGIELNITDNRKMFDYIDINSSKIKFRGYQIDAVSSLTSNSSGILIAPAGSGKTVMGLSTIPMVGQPTLWLTHTGPLAAQAKERAEAFLPSIGEIGLIGKGEWKKGEILTIGMIQTLVRNVDSLYKMRDDFGMIIVDECLVAGTKITMLDGSEKDIEDVVDGDTTTFGVVSNKFQRNANSTVKLRGNWGTIEGSPTHKMPFVSAEAPGNVLMASIEEIQVWDYLLTKPDRDDTVYDMYYAGGRYKCVPVLHKEVIKKDTVVYDFTTEKHLFFANGILSSNCHHVPSRTFLDVIGQFNSYYTYGLTATPNRRDKLEGLMYQAIGVNTTTIPIERVAEAGGIMLPVVVCRRIYSDKVDGNDLQRILRDCIVDNTKRTDIIIADVLKAAVDGHYCIVVSDRREHCEILYKRLSAVWPKTGIATGKYSKKYVQEQVRAYNENEITILVTTASLLGEGFDVPFLDRAFVTMPFRSETKTEQIIGRIQRSFPGKKDAVVFDYVDVNIGVLENQFSSKNNNSRSRVYNRLGVPIEYN